MVFGGYLAVFCSCEDIIHYFASLLLFAGTIVIFEPLLSVSAAKNKCIYFIG